MLSRVAVVLGLALHLHIHHHFRGSPVDYLGLGLAAFASWVGLPGPGEPLLIAAGVLAARHKLDLASVLLVAWFAASLGGILGWLGGMLGGRRIVTAPGPLRRMRRKAVARGEEVFQRVPVLAIVLTPSWVAGIHRVRPAIYLPTNFISAAVWSGGIGVGAYLVGPAVIEVVQDLGIAFVVGIVLLVAVAIVLQVRRRRRKGHAEDGTPTPSER